jgi:transposase
MCQPQAAQLVENRLWQWQVYSGNRTPWTKAHRGWLADQTFAQPAQRIVLEESIEAVRLSEQRRDRVDGYLRAQIPSWSLFPLVQNLCALRGLDMIASAGLAAAIGDPSRFATAPYFTAYLGMVPSEHTSGPKRCIGAIIKAGDIHARTMLIEAAHSFRYPARIAVTSWQRSMRCRRRCARSPGRHKRDCVSAFAR